MSSQSVKDIRIIAGPHAYEVIRDGGLSWNDIAVYFGPAVGPRWLIAAGFDLSLLKSGVLGKVRPLLLIGASAGAWRLSTWIQPDAERSYLSLLEAYISAMYTEKDNPTSIQQSLLNIIDQAIETDALPFALKHPRYRLAIITARAKHLTAFSSKVLQGFGFTVCYLLNALSPRFIFSFVERVIFYSGPLPPPSNKSICIPLSPSNFKAALLASGAIPLVVEGVRNIFGAPRGTYRDGGLTDYQLNSALPPHAYNGFSLSFLHQARIIPAWLDKKLNRYPKREMIEKTVLALPSEDLIARLPEGRVPERDDFIRYMSEPERRIKNWRKAVRLTSHLGEVFMELVESGKIREKVERIPLNEPPL